MPVSTISPKVNPQSSQPSFGSTGTESILDSFTELPGIGGVPSPINLPGQNTTYVEMAINSGKVSSANIKYLTH
jgi:hypothetical protein